MQYWHPEEVSQTITRCLMCGRDLVGGSCLSCSSRLTLNPLGRISRLEAANKAVISALQTILCRYKIEDNDRRAAEEAIKAAS